MLPVTELDPFIYDVAPSVAYTVWNRFKGYVDRDDLKQECIQWALTRTVYITEQLSVEDKNERKHNEQKLAHSYYLTSLPPSLTVQCWSKHKI